MSKCNLPVIIAPEIYEKSQGNKSGTVEISPARYCHGIYCAMKTASETILGIFYMIWHASTVKPRIMRMRRVCASARLNCA